MTNKQLLTLLDSKCACADAREWVNGQSAKEAWEKCNRPDWLFWICGVLRVDRKQITLAACKCARLALKFVKEGENCPRICIETTERWVVGKATIEEVRKAAAAAYSAYAADAADAAADAAAAAAYSAYSAYADAARNKMLIACCIEIRKIIKFKELLKLAKLSGCEGHTEETSS